MAEESINKFKKILENHPMFTLIGVFATGVVLAYTILMIYYNDRINDIKDSADEKVRQQIKECESNLRIKVIEIQAEERERYYLKIEENSINGKLLEKTLDLIEKNKKDEK